MKILLMAIMLAGFTSTPVVAKTEKETTKTKKSTTSRANKEHEAKAHEHKHTEKRVEKKSQKQTKSPSKNYRSKSSDPVAGSTASGRTVYRGERGGLYYVTEGGNKEYITQEQLR